MSCASSQRLSLLYDEDEDDTDASDAVESWARSAGGGASAAVGGALGGSRVAVGVADGGDAWDAGPVWGEAGMELTAGWGLADLSRDAGALSALAFSLGDAASALRSPPPPKTTFSGDVSRLMLSTGGRSNVLPDGAVTIDAVAVRGVDGVPDEVGDTGMPLYRDGGVGMGTSHGVAGSAFEERRDDMERFEKRAVSDGRLPRANFEFVRASGGPCASAIEGDRDTRWLECRTETGDAGVLSEVGKVMGGLMRCIEGIMDGFSRSAIAGCDDEMRFDVDGSSSSGARSTGWGNGAPSEDVDGVINDSADDESGGGEWGLYSGPTPPRRVNRRASDADMYDPLSSVDDILALPWIEEMSLWA